MINHFSTEYARQTILLILLLLLTAGASLAQTTTFTYQGRLTDGGTPANGNYAFVFALFDTPTVGTGTQQGPTALVFDVTVTSGVFVVQLDFGAGVFTGADRFLEIAVKQTSASTFTTLSPRQPLTSTPYSIRSLNATTADGLSVACVSCITSNQIGKVSGSTVSGTIPVASVPAGSANYIQNTTSQQSSSNFNISGDGQAGGQVSANFFNSMTAYYIANQRVLSVAGVNNTFTGIGAGGASTGNNNSFFGTESGNSNTTGASNSFFGSQAGQANKGNLNSFFGSQAGRANTTGGGNAFFGSGAGLNNTTGGSNAFFGSGVGPFNTTGTDNSFFGNGAGFNNTTGLFNSFFGSGAGRANTTSCCNAFFGSGAGQNNTTGGTNAFFGQAAGTANTTGFSNSFFGNSAGFSNTTGIFNSLFGFNAGKSNTTGIFNSFFGNSAGFSNTTGNDNSFFGSVGGVNNTTGSDNSFFGDEAGFANTAGLSNSFFGKRAGFSNITGSNNTYIGARADSANGLTNATVIGANAFVSQSNSVVLGNNAKVGIGTSAPTEKLTVATATGSYGFIHTDGTITVGSFIGGSTGGGWYGTKSNHPLSFFTNNGGASMTIDTNGNVGIGTSTPTEKLTVKTAPTNYGFIHTDGTVTVGSFVGGSTGGGWYGTKSNHSLSFFVNDGGPSMTIDIGGIVHINALANAGATSLCRNFQNQISTCGSSLRYKTAVRPFFGGLDIINRLRPISFTWKDHPERDLGLGAEDVAAIEPLLVTHNATGQVEGVKYDHLNVVLINAIQQQQAQIKQQQTQIESLKKLVCQDHPNEEVCK